MIPSARLTVLFDCCHSGSAIELPYVYRPNSQGEVNLIDNVKQGINLANAAMNLIHGGFSAAKINDAKALMGGAKTFFAALHHRPDGPVNEHGLGEETFMEDWKHEGMFGCLVAVLIIRPLLILALLEHLQVCRFRNCLFTFADWKQARCHMHSLRP
jgi:hypothetical protein